VRPWKVQHAPGPFLGLGQQFFVPAAWTRKNRASRPLAILPWDFPGAGASSALPNSPLEGRPSWAAAKLRLALRGKTRRRRSSVTTTDAGFGWKGYLNPGGRHGGPGRPGIQLVLQRGWSVNWSVYLVGPDDRRNVFRPSIAWTDHNYTQLAGRKKVGIGPGCDVRTGTSLSDGPSRRCAPKAAAVRTTQAVGPFWGRRAAKPFRVELVNQAG